VQSEVDAFDLSESACRKLGFDEIGGNTSRERKIHSVDQACRLDFLNHGTTIRDIDAKRFLAKDWFPRCNGHRDIVAMPERRARDVDDIRFVVRNDRLGTAANGQIGKRLFCDSARLCIWIPSQMEIERLMALHVSQHAMAHDPEADECNSVCHFSLPPFRRSLTSDRDYRRLRKASTTNLYAVD